MSISPFPMRYPLLVKAARRERVSHPPAWKMCQAGRYMAVYRKLAEKHTSFRERLESPELIEDISLHPWEAFYPDGVIIFLDIGEQATILGFAGAPLPIATYIVDREIAEYTIYQVEYGAHCIQIFDSWVGQLPPYMWDCWSKPYIDEVMELLEQLDCWKGKTQDRRVIKSGINTWKTGLELVSGLGIRTSKDGAIPSSSGDMISDLCEDKFLPKYYHKNDLALVIGIMKSSAIVYGTVLRAILKLSNTNYTIAGYGESETVDPSMKIRNMLPGSEGSDHSTLILECRKWEKSNSYFKFENWWLQIENFKDGEDLNMHDNTKSNLDITDVVLPKKLHEYDEPHRGDTSNFVIENDDGKEEYNSNQIFEVQVDEDFDEVNLVGQFSNEMESKGTNQQKSLTNMQFTSTFWLPPSLDSTFQPPSLFDGTTRLYINYQYPYAQRAWITRNFKGLQDKIKLVPINLQNRPAWYKEKVYTLNKCINALILSSIQLALKLLYRDFEASECLNVQRSSRFTLSVIYISTPHRSLVEDYTACLDFQSEECQIIKDCHEDSGVLILQHQDEEISDDDFEFAGNDVVDLLPKNIDLDVDEDIVNMEAQFEEIPQSSANEEHEIKSSLSGVNGLPKGFKALARTLSMPKPKSPIEPPKYYEKPAKIGALCYGPPGTGKIFLSRAVANRTNACFIRVIDREPVQNYVSKGARMVRELF
ncbi:hypothetical protein BC332_27841 [Capsicum chinense]|nr:hypothetical protein BC332_27841 [Capsicum chinense]